MIGLCVCLIIGSAGAEGVLSDSGISDRSLIQDENVKLKKKEGKKKGVMGLVTVGLA